jgi:hypothetical protein
LKSRLTVKPMELLSTAAVYKKFLLLTNLNATNKSMSF